MDPDHRLEINQTKILDGTNGYWISKLQLETGKIQGFYWKCFQMKQLKCLQLDSRVRMELNNIQTHNLKAGSTYTIATPLRRSAKDLRTST